MPWPRPTLAEIDARLAADASARLPGVDPQLRRSIIAALVRAVAGAHHEFYGLIDWVSRQVFPDTAEAAELDRWAAIWGIDRIAAKAAAGTITVTGTTGAVVPAGTRWRRGDGMEYVATAEATISVGEASVLVRAAEAGQDANVGVGARVMLMSPIADVISEAVIATEITGGSDVESDAALRSRLIARIRSSPAAGTATDYLRWARAADVLVTRAWARSNTPALGQVTVYLMTDAATANGIPAPEIVSRVAAYISSRRPLTADVTVSAPAPMPINFTIRSLTPDTTAVRAAIEAEIADLVIRDSEPGGTIHLSRVREAISSAQGEMNHMLVAPTNDVTYAAGEIAVAGTVTWQ